MTTRATTITTSSAWSPLRVPVYRAVWLATVASNIGTWVSILGTGWLMTMLTPSSLMVALVQAASTLPIFLFALPAGALADIVDRRHLLIATQIFMAAIAVALGVATLAGGTTPTLVLAATFAMGIGAALTAPAFQAIVHDLVPKAQFKAAIALNSLGINVSRAIGPALAGLLIASVGPASPFFLNAASFVGAIAVFIWWRSPKHTNHLPAERLMSAIKTGLRYAREAPSLRATIVRAGAFFIFGSAYWALLPLLARGQLGGGPGTYGVLLGCIGAGAVGGAMCLPRIRSRVPPDALVLAASLGTSAVVAGLALVQTLLAAVPLMLIGGAFWVTVLSTLNVAAQVTLPNWVKARGLSIYFVAFNGGLALGSPLWGLVAGYAGVPLALIASAVGLALASVAVLRWRLPPMESPDLSPSMHWPTPLVAIGDLDHRHGPVMVQLEYRIASDRHDAFLTALAELGRIRRRDGAISWNHLVDAADPVRHVETFYLETWLEHLRQHDRVTVADRELQDKVRAFHLGTDPPRVSHLVPVRHLRHPS